MPCFGEQLIINLKTGKIFAAGLDVFPTEPLPKHSPLLTLPNVTLTPHMAFHTEEAECRLSQTVTANIKAFLEGHPQHIVS